MQRDNRESGEDRRGIRENELKERKSHDAYYIRTRGENNYYVK